MKLGKNNILLWAAVAALLVVGLFLVVPEVMAQDNKVQDGEAAIHTGAKTGMDAAGNQATDGAGKTGALEGVDGSGDSDDDDGFAGAGAAVNGNGSSGNGSSSAASDNGNGTGGGGNTSGSGSAPGSNGTVPGGSGTAANTKTCYLAIDCSTILSNKDKLNPAKAGYLPASGWIMPRRAVTFTEGESVFDILKREVQASGIHMEFVLTPMYNSAYIEGINNLYEFDCGELSGWMYKVNGWYPNYSCSLYYPHNGDVIEWRYTCDLGADIGGAGAVSR